MKYRKFTALIMSVVIILAMTACSENTDTDISNNETVETVSETDVKADGTTITEMQTISKVTTTEMTKVAEETTASEYIPSPDAVVINSETLGEYVLDRSLVFEENYNAYWDNINEQIGRPRLVSMLDDADVYVMAVQKAEVEEGTDPLEWYVIISHNGVVDEITADWATRFGDVFDIYQGDYDNDGENEIATIRYVAGGTLCRIEELSVYKNIDGHYQRFSMSHDTMLDEHIEYTVDNDNHRLTVNFKGTDVTYEMDTAELFPNGIESLYWYNVVTHTAENNTLTTTAQIFIQNDKNYPDTNLHLTVDVDFENGEFAFSNPVFEYKTEEY